MHDANSGALMLARAAGFDQSDQQNYDTARPMLKSTVPYWACPAESGGFQPSRQALPAVLLPTTVVLVLVLGIDNDDFEPLQ